MIKQYFILLSVLFSGVFCFAQGTETFNNMPASNGTYLARTWTGDGGITWTAGSARTDGPGATSSVTGMNTRFIIMRNTTGILSATIPNGIGILSFKYAKAFTAAANIPTFGVFINGAQSGSTVTASSNAAVTASYTINTTGNVLLEIRQLTANDNGRLALDDVSWTGNGIPCDEPTAQPTNLNLSATATSVSGSFTMIPDPTTVENYLVVRSTSATLSDPPADGITYSAGQVINGGNGTVIGISNDGTFSDNPLSPSTAYYYFIFAVNDQACSGGPNYFQTGPLTGNISTPPLAVCTTPAAPGGLSLTASNTTVSGSFTGSGAGKYLVVISTSNTLGAAPVNGTAYSAGQTLGNGTVVSANGSTAFLATNLSNSTQYYIYIFAANTACTGEPAYSTSSLNGNIVTTNVAGGIPAGYYDAAAGLSCQPLKTALKNISSNGYVSLSYADVYTAYQFTDIHRNDANTANIIWDIYSDNPTGPEPYTYTYPTNECGNYTGEGNCYNREHSTPKSWFNDALPMYTDIQHLYPTDGSVNGIRSNYPYGEVITASKTTQNGSRLGTGNNFGYSAVVFEPINEYKGDLARTSLYMATRYENEIIGNNWSANGTAPGLANNLFLSPADETDAAKRKLQIYDTWYLKTMFKWLNQDPVSQKEIDRNNAIYYQTAQHNRNPYIDHPEYAALVFQCTGVVPVTLVNFTAQKNKESVLLKWYATYETSFRQYDIERSIDGIVFNKIGDVAGTNAANYSFTDNYLPKAAVVYYRLKMIDIDGKSKAGKVVSVRLNNNLSNAIVYPNPTAGLLHIKLSAALEENSLLSITDVTGRTVKKQPVNVNELNVNLSVNGLAAGRYFIRISNSRQVITESFVVIK